MWPFKRAVEKRDSSYTDALVSILVSRATGDSAQISATWSAEVSAILYSRAFAAARISPKNDLTAAITPAVMGQIGRDLVRRGESLHLIDMDSGRLELRPAGSWDVRGGPRESDWAYRMDLCGPSVQQSRLAPSAEVVHARYQTDPSSPWRGVSPLAGASLTADLLAAVELRLGQECLGASGYVMPMPQAPSGVDDLDPLAKLVADIKGAKGSNRFYRNHVRRIRRGPRRRARPRLDAVSIRRESARGVESTAIRRGDGRAPSLWRSGQHGNVKFGRHGAKGKL